MTAVVLLVLLVAVAWIVARLWPVESWWLSLRAAVLKLRIRHVRSRLRQADEELSRAHAKARRQMNDVAGQSWRNPFE